MKHTKKPTDILHNLEQLDSKLIDLLQQRAKLLHTLKKKGYIPSEDEKHLRQHWESTIGTLSTDKNATHTLFQVIQNLEFSSQEKRSRSAFSLAPSTSPVAYTLRVQQSATLSMYVLLYTAVAHCNCRIPSPLLTDNLQVFCKILASVGVKIQWEHNAITLEDTSFTLQDVVLRCADSEQALYCSIALATAVPASIKFVGGLTLSTLELSELKSFLQTLDIRFTSLGGVAGIPAKLESIATQPSAVSCPPTLPATYIIALAMVLAADTTPHTIDFAHHPHAEDILHTLLLLCSLLPISFSHSQYSITVHSEEEPFVGEITLPTDPSIALIQLLPPYFVGGSATLQGNFTSTIFYKHLFCFLESLGLSCTTTPSSVTVSAQEKARFFPSTLPTIPQEYAPLLFAAFLTHIRNTTKPKEDYTTILDQLLILEHAKSFADAVGFDYTTATLKKATHPWVAPTFIWAVAFSYSAFAQKNLSLANPYLITAEFPTFWNFYNALPMPANTIPTLHEEATVLPRRRIFLKKDE